MHQKRHLDISNNVSKCVPQFNFKKKSKYLTFLRLVSHSILKNVLFLTFYKNVFEFHLL